MADFDQNDLVNIRLRNQQLVAPVFERVGELVSWMGAMQAQDYAMVKWAVGLRLKEGTLTAVNEALGRGEIVRTHVMRPTWHLVAGEDIRWMLKLSGQRVKKCIDLWTKAGGLDIPERLYTQCNDWIGKILSGHRSMTKEDIGIELGRAGIPADPDHLRRYMLRAEMEGIVCSGADQGGKPTYALLDEHVATVPELSKEEALARLALNYFRSHTPATLKDFVWWSGLSVTEAKVAVGLLPDKLYRVHRGDQEWLIPEYAMETGKEAGLHFLPSYDEYLIAYKDRSLVLDTLYTQKAHNRWGIFYPVILDKGRVAGNWTKIIKKENIAVQPSFFELERDVDAERLRLAEKKYLKFYGKN